MNVLQLHVNDIVFFSDWLIRVTHIKKLSNSIYIEYDILENSLFLTKIAWSFYVFYKNDFYKDLFYV